VNRTVSIPALVANYYSFYSNFKEELTMSKKQNSPALAQALKNFECGYSCSQAVLEAFCKKYELERNSALKLADSFSGGMGGMALTCGAVTGAFMVIGLKYGRIAADDLEAKAKTRNIVQQFSEQFRAKHKYITCKDLLNCDISIESGQLYAKENNLFKTLCPQYVADAVNILETILNEYK
jgi:C_GCAxxG_C_C family probable redox protein